MQIGRTKERLVVVVLVSLSDLLTPTNEFYSKQYLRTASVVSLLLIFLIVGLVALLDSSRIPGPVCPKNVSHLTFGNWRVNMLLVDNLQCEAEDNFDLVFMPNHKYHTHPASVFDTKMQICRSATANYSSLIY